MKPFNFVLFNQVIQVYIFLFISINFVKNDNNSNCQGCTIDNEKKCILQEGSTFKCISNCRPDLYNNNGICYDCSEAFSSSQLYSIENGICKYKAPSNCKKIIIENNQCVNDCGSLYEFGDYCYIECIESIMVTDYSNTKCECKKYTLEGEAQEKKYLSCVDSCPFGYFNSRTKYCMKKCEGDNNRINPDNGCTDDCVNNYLLTQTETINEESITYNYCVSNCPNSAKFFYYSEIEEKKCLTECKKGEYFKIKQSEQIIEYECLDSCDNMTLIDINSNFYQCANIPQPTNYKDYKCGEGEAKDYPYQYKNYCLMDCKDTQKLDILQKKETYFLTFIDTIDGDKEKKFCSEDCSEDSNQPYSDLSTLSCHKTCYETSNKYYNNDKQCINSCDNTNLPYHLETGECVYQCPENYHLLENEKTCYQICPEDSEYKYIDVYNKCNTCKIPQDINNIQNGEGYIYIHSNGTYYCLKSCSINFIEEDGSTFQKNYHYKNKDNKCINSEEECEVNNKDYKYSIGGNVDNNYKYICYKSCKDIPGNYIYAKKYSCYKEKTDIDSNILNTPYYYYNDSGIYRYIDNEDEAKTGCSNKGFYYLKEDGKHYECVKECNPEEFRIIYTLDEDGKINQFGKCLDNCLNGEENSPNNYYFSLNEKICYKECPYKSIYKVSGGTVTPQFDVENCFNKCPLNYPYESIDGKSCYDSCPNKFYIEINGKKKMC